MRTVERAGLLVVLAAASGSADGWSYFGLGHAFVANMTGNTVMLGVSVFHLRSDAVHPLVALCGYIAGTVLGTLICRRVEPARLWSKSTSWVLFSEALLLLGVEAGWVATRESPGGSVQLGLLACAAMALGMQSAAMFQLQVPGVATTYITGTWTTLTNGVTRLLIRRPEIMRQEKQSEERFALQAAVLGAYFLSAVFTGWAFRHITALVGILPALAILLVAVYGALRN